MSLLSPGIQVREIDASGVTESATSTNGSFAGKFRWGPVLERVRVANEEQLTARFGTPVTDNATDFLTAASFLAYTNALDVVRIGNETDMKNAVSSGSAVAILNDDDYSQTASELSSIHWVAKWPGALGNSLSVATCISASNYSVVLPGTWAFSTTTRTKTVTYTPAVAEELSDYFNVGDSLLVDNVRYRVVGINDTTNILTLDKIYVGVASPTVVRREWAYANQFGVAPGTNEIHVVVVDTTGQFTKEPGSIVESYKSLSTVAGTKYADGTPAYYIDAINTRSSLIRVGGSSIATVNGSALKVTTLTLTGGDDGFPDMGTDEYIFAYDLFKNSEEVEAPLIIAGESIIGSDAVLANYLIDNLVGVRKDGVVFISPSRASVINNKGFETDDVIADRNALSSSSYAHMDSGWKLMYDKYNGVNRWVPLNGDMAGIYARVDQERDTWWSGAGKQRGVVKNVVRLAWSPDQTQRDLLYVKDVNAVTDFPVDGPTLFGDKTLLGSSTAFNRMNVRRLFLHLEKIISRATRDLLFEFNDEFTQRRFVATVEPFLREVQGRRGIDDFRVIADSSVNTPQVVQTNRFVAKIFVKPNYVVNFITLDFIAVNASASFEEVAGVA